MEHHCPSVVCLILQLILTFLTPSSPQHSFPWLDPYSPSLCQQPQPHSVHIACRLPSGTFTSPLLPCSLPRALSVRPLGIQVLTFWRRWIFHVLSILTFEIYAAAAKSLQSCSTLCDPIDDSPPGSTIPGILQARTLKWVAISFSNAWKWKVKVKSLSHVRLFRTPWTAAYQAPLSMGFSRQGYWSGLPCLLRLRFIYHS